MSNGRVIVLQGPDIKKIEEELTTVLKESDGEPASITQSQSAVPVIDSRMGWENIITITVVYTD
jgi:hypothetical protein